MTMRPPMTSVELDDIEQIAREKARRDYAEYLLRERGITNDGLSLVLTIMEIEDEEADNSSGADDDSVADKCTGLDGWSLEMERGQSDDGQQVGLPSIRLLR